MIFGVQASRFVTTTGSTIDLDYDILEMANWIEPNIITHESVINKHREFIKIADPHASFSVVINLHKYPIPFTKFIEIYNHLTTLVYFYPHRDGGALNNTNGDPIKFFFAAMEPFCLDEPYYDALRLTFVSQDGIDFTQSLTGFLIDKNDNLFIDKDGDNLIIKPGRQFGEIEETGTGDPGGTSEETI